jgi:predicted DNA-binding transcriptional regulator YafY
MLRSIATKRDKDFWGLSSRPNVDYARVLIRSYLKRTKTIMTEASPLVRQWILLRTLCARHYGATVKELSTEMGVSEKTIRRDLETFQTAGFPLVETVEDFGRKKWHIDPTKNQPGMCFAYDEAIALYLGRRFLEPLAGTVFWEAAQRAFKKIRASFGKDAQKYVDQFGDMFHQTMVGISDYSKKAELIDDLMVGIEDHLAVFITYQSLRATEPVTYDIYPYGLAYHRGSLYLIGCAPQHNEIRHWKVDRIENADLTEIRFNRPEDFDLQEHLKGSFGIYHGDGDVQIRVRFSPEVARYVSESKWHDSQILKTKKDGSVIAEFHLDDTEEIKRWVLSFGKHATVLEPASLCQNIVAEANALIESYRFQDFASDKARPHHGTQLADSREG